MIIRKFREEDAKKVSYIIRRCLREINSADYSPEVIKSLCHFLRPTQLIRNMKDRAIFVAVDNGKVVGTASLKKNTVYTVFVNPSIHKKGIGTKLMNKVEDLAKKNGYKEVKVPSGYTSVGFYKKIGYKKIKVVRKKGHADTIEMKKRL
jgi:predicted N-acetyltransferase YhbS